MSDFSAGLAIPDSRLAREAMGILRAHSSDLLFNHSVRVYLFAAEQGRQKKLGSMQNSCTSLRHFTISV